MRENIFISIVGTIGSAIATALGGWDASLKTLIIFMIIDYMSGLIVAGIFKNSRKTATGAIESNTCWKGLAKKVMVLFFVLIGTRLDIAVSTTYIRDAICIAFITNELISIVENAGLMGIHIPKPITNAIDILKKKTEEENE